MLANFMVSFPLHYEHTEALLPRAEITYSFVPTSICDAHSKVRK